MRTVSALFGVTLLLSGAVVAFAPDQLPPAVRTPIEGVDIGSVLETGLHVVTLMALLFALLARSATTAHPQPPVTVADNTQTDRSVETVGRSFDARIEEYNLYRQQTDLPAPNSGPGLESVLVATIARTEKVSEAEARRLLTTGEWTSNRQAALLFADDLTPTVTERFVAWLRPETVFKQRVAAAIDELGRRSESINGLGSSRDSR